MLIKQLCETAKENYGMVSTVISPHGNGIQHPFSFIFAPNEGEGVLTRCMNGLNRGQYTGTHPNKTEVMLWNVLNMGSCLETYCTSENFS